MSQTNPNISRYLRGECRRAFAVYAFARVHTSGGMTKKQQESMFYDLFHGSDKYPSHVLKLSKGEEPYNRMYVTKTVTDTTAASASALVVRDFFCFKESIRHVKAGVHINKKVLEQVAFSGGGLVQGRALLTLAKTSMQTIRKAISILLPKLDSNMKPLRSGKTMEDIWKEVLDELFVQLRGKVCVVDDVSPSMEHNDPDSQETVVTPDTSSRPASWLPEGWIALHLFGPAPEKDRLNILDISDPAPASGGGKKKRGLAYARSEEAALQKKAREADTTGERGLSIGHRIGIAGIIIQRQTLQRDAKEAEYVYHNFHAGRLTDAIHQQISIIKLYAEGTEDHQEAIGKLKKLEKERDVFNESLTSKLLGKDPEEKGQIDKTKLALVDDLIKYVTPKKGNPKDPSSEETIGHEMDEDDDGTTSSDSKVPAQSPTDTTWSI